jgi:predicted transcriptional regulator YdeE
MGPGKHEIAELEAMAVRGVCGVVACGEDVGNLWEPTFVRRMKEIQAMAVVASRYYGVSFDKGGHLYLAGMVVSVPGKIPDGLVLREIPAGTYVRFEGSFDEWWCKDGPGWFHGTRSPGSGYDHHQPTTMRDFVIHGVAGRVTFYAPIQERRDIREDAALAAGEEI